MARGGLSKSTVSSVRVSIDTLMTGDESDRAVAGYLAQFLQANGVTARRLRDRVWFYAPGHWLPGWRVVQWRGGDELGLAHPGSRVPLDWGCCHRAAPVQGRRPLRPVSARRDGTGAWSCVLLDRRLGCDCMPGPATPEPTTAGRSSFHGGA